MKGTLKIPEAALTFYHKYKSNTKVQMAVPPTSQGAHWPMCITSGLVALNGKGIEFKEIAYNHIELKLIERGIKVEHVIIEDPSHTIGCSIPIAWIEQA